jgi:hypothetical protein
MSFMSIKKGQTVGSLNGWNSLSLQLFLRTWPVILGLMGWLIYETILNSAFRTQGDRFTAAQGEALESRVKEWHHGDVDAWVSYIAQNYTRKPQ